MSSVGFRDSAVAFVKAWDQSPLGKLPVANLGAALGSAVGFSMKQGFLGRIGGLSLGAGAGFVAAKVIGLGMDHFLRAPSSAVAKQQYTQTKQDLGSVTRACTEASGHLGLATSVATLDVPSQVRAFGHEIQKIEESVTKLTTALGKTAELEGMTLAKKVDYLQKNVTRWVAEAEKPLRKQLGQKDRQIHGLEEHIQAQEQIISGLRAAPSHSSSSSSSSGRGGDPSRSRSPAQRRHRGH